MPCLQNFLPVFFLLFALIPACFAFDNKQPSSQHTSKEEDQRVVRGYQYLHDYQPLKAIACFTGPLIESLHHIDTNSSRTPVRYLLLIAYAFYMNKNEEAAAQCFTIALKLNPHKNYAYATLLKLNHIKNNKEKYLNIIKEWVNNCPTSAQAWSCLGSYFQEQKSWQQAISAYTKAQNLFVIPTLQSNLDAKIEFCLLNAQLGTCYFKIENIDKAFEKARIFNEFRPKGPQTDELANLPVRPPTIDFSQFKPESPFYKAAEHATLADILFETGNLNAAVEEYRKAISFDPDNISWHSCLLKVLLTKNDFLGAAREDAIVTQHIVSHLPETIQGTIKNIKR